ncbi:MAG TPA: hypothetical protein VF223_08505, partial [Trebonia sp.]
YHVPATVSEAIRGSLDAALDVAARIGGQVGAELADAAGVAIGGCIIALVLLPRRRAPGLLCREFGAITLRTGSGHDGEVLNPGPSLQQGRDGGAVMMPAQPQIYGMPAGGCRRHDDLDGRARRAAAGTRRNRRVDEPKLLQVRSLDCLRISPEHLPVSFPAPGCRSKPLRAGPVSGETKLTSSSAKGP